MDTKNYRIIYAAIAIAVFFQSCDSEECYTDPNLHFPEFIYNIPKITQTYNPTLVGQEYHPNGTIVGANNAYNELFSVTRFVQGIGNITYFWSRGMPPSFNNLIDGETINYYKLVYNSKNSEIECIFSEVREVKSILEVKIRTENGEIVGERIVEQTILKIPAGKYGIFNFQFDYILCGDYEFNITIDPDGNLSETSIDDNNYSETQANFGFCF